MPYILQLCIMSQNIHVSPAAIKEEIANIYTHGFGVLLSIPATYFLLIRAYDHQGHLEIISAYIFGGSLVILYLASTIYHASNRPNVKAFFKILDHAAIFLLIAGTYTPFVLVGLKDKIHVSFILIMWGIALVGIIFKLLAIDKYEKISLLIYLAMGWMAIFRGNTFYRFLSGGALMWIVIGGICYSLGTIFYANKRIVYHHSIWHIFVLCGSASHFIAIYFYVY